MNLQQIEIEVQHRVDARMGDVLANIIQKQLNILDEVPDSFESYDAYVEWSLGQYVQSKIFAHRLRRLIDSGCGSSMAPLTSRKDDDLQRLAFAESRVKVCRDRYYKAVGKDYLNAPIKIRKSSIDTNLKILWDNLTGTTFIPTYDTGTGSGVFNFQKGMWENSKDIGRGIWSHSMSPYNASCAIRVAISLSKYPMKSFIAAWKETPITLNIALICTEIEEGSLNSPPDWFSFG